MTVAQLHKCADQGVDVIGEIGTLRLAGNEVQGRLLFGPPKTTRSIRSVTMPKALKDELAAHMSMFPPGDDRLVSTAHAGGPLRRNYFRRRVWIPAVTQSVGRPFTFHGLRHSHAALLIAAGQHPKLIQERLGHASIRTSLDAYGHLFDGIDQAAADAIDDALTAERVGLALHPGSCSRTNDTENPQ